MGDEQNTNMEDIPGGKEMRILCAVKEASLPVGAAYLSKKMDIPQATIGRALYELEKRGLIEKVSNKGRQLTEDGRSFLEFHRDLEEKKSTVNHLILMVGNVSRERLLETLEIRMMIEPQAAALACRKASDEELKHLDLLILEHIYQMRHDGTGASQDLDFHLEIARLSGNETLYEILKLLLTKEGAYTRFNQAAKLAGKGQIHGHDEIGKALWARDETLAREAMRKHLAQVIADVKEQEA